MTYSAIGGISNLDLYKLTKIVSKGMVYPQLPAASAIWKKILSNTSGDAKGREQRFEVLTGRGPASFQFSAFNGDFPTFQASEVTEGTVNWKDFDVSIAYDLSLQDKTGEDLVAYARPYVLEMEQKGLSVARSLSAAAMGDGSGVIGVVLTAAVNTTTEKLTVVLDTTTANADRSHPGWFEIKDLVKFATTAAVAHGTINNAGTTVTSWRVVSANQDTSTIVLEALDATGAIINLTSATLGATDPAVGDCIYRKGTTPNDLTAISTNDYNSISQVFAGIASLTADDGRVVNGLTMSGTLAGSRQSAAGALLTPKHFQKLLSNMKRRTGGVSGDKALTYSEALMHDIVYDVMWEQAEANRTWFNVTDVVTGMTKLGHRAGKTLLEFTSDEFIPFQRTYVLPDQKGPVSFLGHDLKQVKVGNATEFLKPSTSGGNYSKSAMTFMSGSGALMTPHAASLGVIENYSLTT